MSKGIVSYNLDTISQAIDIDIDTDISARQMRELERKKRKETEKAALAAARAEERRQKRISACGKPLVRVSFSTSEISTSTWACRDRECPKCSKYKAKRHLEAIHRGLEAGAQIHEIIISPQDERTNRLVRALKDAGAYYIHYHDASNNGSAVSVVYADLSALTTRQQEGYKSEVNLTRRIYSTDDIDFEWFVDLCRSRRSRRQDGSRKHKEKREKEKLSGETIEAYDIQLAFLNEGITRAALISIITRAEIESADFAPERSAVTERNVRQYTRHRVKLIRKFAAETLESETGKAQKLKIWVNYVKRKTDKDRIRL